MKTLSKLAMFLLILALMIACSFIRINQWTYYYFHGSNTKQSSFFKSSPQYTVRREINRKKLCLSLIRLIISVVYFKILINFSKRSKRLRESIKKKRLSEANNNHHHLWANVKNLQKGLLNLVTSIFFDS